MTFFYKYQCVPQCQGNTYPDYTQQQCADCDISCLACNGPNYNQCTACHDQFLRTQEKVCDVECPLDQYSVLSEKRCHSCHSTCLTCFGPSNTNCLSCLNYFYLNQCVDSCPDGFTKSINSMSCEPNFLIVIDQCSYQCSTCILSARFCTNCSANRAPNAPNCDCEMGYYDDGSNPTCLPCDNKCFLCTGNPDNCIRCKGDRLLPNCDCPPFYYDDGSSVFCVKCQDNCKTCNSTQCLSCLADRINVPQCICPIGYFEAYQYYCQECSLRCQTCSGTANLCDSCSDIRIQLPICLCPIGYFENSNIECQQCEPSCHDCNQYGCLSCSANRIGPFQGNCICNLLGINRMSIGSNYCTDCQVGVPSFTLNDDLSGFSFEFGGQVQIHTNNVQEDLCLLFFDTNTLLKLGTNPICDDDFNIIFGDNPTIQLNDNLQLNLQFLLSGCQYNFLYIVPMPLVLSNNVNTSLIKPIVKLKYLNKPNVCDYIKFEFDQLYYNGKQSVRVISWNSVHPQNIQEIDQILQKFSQNSSTFLIFPPKIFSINVHYIFSVTIESFAKLQNTIEFQFDAVQYSIIKFQPTNQQNQFHKFDNINIPNQLSYINCIEQSPPPQILYYEINVQNKINKSAQGTLTDNLVDGFSLDVPISFKPYTFDLGSYTLIYLTILSRPDYNISYTSQFDIYIKSYDPILSILGGDRMTGYTNDIKLNLTVYDMDYQDNNSFQYQCQWKCTDIVNGTACINAKNELLVFNTDCNQYIPSYTFKPYSVVIFQGSINKKLQIYSTKVTIQLMETDLEQLLVFGINKNKTYNYYDEFLLQLIYPGINPDLLMYAGALIYNSSVVATFQFFYLDFKFKLQNYFVNFNAPLTNSIKLRLSIYDPRFIMPSINTQILTMNIPPSNCKLNTKITNSFVEFLDYITISVEGCYDTDLPLLYSLLLFPNQTIYDNEVKTAIYYNYILLIPPQKEQFFYLTLPYLGNEDLLLLINIEDSFDGISNMTQKVHVKQYHNLTEDTIQEYSQNQISFDNKLIGYRVLTQRLSLYDGISEQKEKLLEQILNLDTNQSLLSNQTKTLYHSLSTIIGSNSTLLLINNVQLLIQIKYRVNIAYQRLLDYYRLQNVQILTSKQNIDKQNYVKQYFAFLDLLSSFIKFHLDQNQTCVDILTLYQTMIEQLQFVSVANEPLYDLIFNSASLNFGVVTAKIADQLTDSIGKVGTNISTDIFKYSIIRYYDNPFYQEKEFPKNSSGYQAVDPKIIEKHLNNLNTKLQSPIKFRFPIQHSVPKNISLKCITKVDQENWSAKICKTKKQGDKILCECEQLSPTSLMQQFDYFVDKGEEVFSQNTLQQFLSFPFYKTIIFYFYVFITGGYVALVVWGMKVDHIMYEKIAVEKIEQDQFVKQNKDISIVQHQEEEQQQKVTEKELIQPVLTLDAFQGRTIFNKISLRLNKHKLIRHYNERTSIKIQPNEKHQENIFNKKIIRDPDPSQLHTSVSSQTNLFNQHSFRSNQYKILKQKQTSQLEGRQVCIPKKVSLLRAYIEYLKYFHQILSLIYKDDPDKPRGLRASIVYTSTIGSLAVLFLFNQPNNLNFTITLAALSAPTNKIYQLILEKLLSNNKRFIRIIGAIFMVVVGGLMSYTMLAGLVLQGQISQANQWSYIFIGTFSSDNLIYSPITLFIKYFIHMRDYKIKFIQTIVDKIFDIKDKEYLRKKIYQS